jgi:hypothetical protein
LARALVRAAEAAPSRTTWDVFPGEAGEAPSWLRAAARPGRKAVEAVASVDLFSDDEAPAPP